MIISIIGIDVGGTFTDFVLWRDGQRTIHKVLSTHPEPEIGVIEGLEELGLMRGNILDVDIVHGSTIATNALLERKGARVALITTQGFEDIIDIGRQNRPELYSFWMDTPTPLVKKDCRLGVAERIGSRGETVRLLDISQLDTLVQKLKEKNIDAVAVCFLFSFLNPAHEQVVEKRLADSGFFVSASYKILPEYREYERFSTTIINAFVTPLVAGYLDRLSTGLGPDLSGNLRIMQSNGGLASAASIAKQAVQTILSGPAGGAVAANELGKLTGTRRLISFDMGGTSTDVGLIDGNIQFTTEFNLDGSPIKIPMVDINTVGAGGGSIAWVDAGGVLQVGPESAGSDPGPVAYGKGDKPTITDANVVLRRLHPGHFLGGRQRLDTEQARRAISKLADECSLDMLSAADGIIRIAVSNMQKAIRRISVERGYDLRDFTLVAFGGAGPMHACEMAEATLIPKVLIPQNPGVFSALGMTVSDVIKDYSKSTLMRQDALAAKVLEEIFTPLIDTARADLALEGFDSDSIELETYLDIRYVGQSFELTIPLEDFSDGFITAFHKMHEERYGHSSPQEEIELVAARVRAVGIRKKPDEATTQKSSGQATPILTTKVYFNGWHETPCYNRENLFSGHKITGPALIFQLDATTVIPPNWEAMVDAFGNLILQVKVKR